MGNDLPDPLPSDLEAEVRALIAQGTVIDAIKWLRQTSGCGLAVANARVSDILATTDLVQPRMSVPCPYCGKPLRTNEAKQCFKCGADWHNPDNLVRRGMEGGQ